MSEPVKTSKQEFTGSVVTNMQFIVKIHSFPGHESFSQFYTRVSIISTWVYQKTCLHSCVVQKVYENKETHEQKYSQGKLHFTLEYLSINKHIFSQSTIENLISLKKCDWNKRDASRKDIVFEFQTIHLF